MLADSTTAFDSSAPTPPSECGRGAGSSSRIASGSAGAAAEKREPSPLRGSASAAAPERRVLLEGIALELCAEIRRIQSGPAWRRWRRGHERTLRAIYTLLPDGPTRRKLTTLGCAKKRRFGSVSRRRPDPLPAARRSRRRPHPASNCGALA